MWNTIRTAFHLARRVEALEESERTRRREHDEAMLAADSLYDKMTKLLARWRTRERRESREGDSAGEASDAPTPNAIAHPNGAAADPAGSVVPVSAAKRQLLAVARQRGFLR